ncbi:acyltransferase [Gordonia sp. HNM0687]|uniref:Acyltransferase n=1 Tax=Gordonia mangrovi TaxID=2665643 RepID=A0A6L7GVR3_9ACTN|nr:condensation domain-containing protein [Gordonia mangrovi]MXP23131.1 acyltransferase [Gordonia mangrovi]UVF77413.1 condensation domain-containing protein [Gordonia mangrovi]
MTRTPVLRAPLVGGTPVEWHLTDPDGARAAAERTPDGLTFLQIDHVNAALAKRESGEPHTGTASSVTVFDEPLDRDAMAAALTAFCRRHDELRAVYPVDDTGPSRRVAPPETIEFVTVSSDDHVDADAVIGLVQQRINAEAVFDRLPGFVFGAIDGGDRFTFYAGYDHSHTDGFSQFAGLLEIARTYRAIRAGQTPDSGPVGSFGDYIAAEKQTVASLTPADPRIAEWRAILAVHDKRIPRFPLDLGLSDSEPAPAAPLRLSLVAGDVLEACDARRGDTASGAGIVYAALAAAQHELTGVEHFFTATVLAARAPHQAQTQGWLCNFAPIAFDVTGSMSFAELTVAATEAVARARRLATLPVHASLGALAAAGAYIPDPGSPQMVSYIDFRRIPGNDDAVLRNVTSFQAAGRTRNANMWLTRRADAMTLIAHIPDNPVAKSTFTAYVEAIRRWLTSYACGDETMIGSAEAPGLAGQST